MGILKGGGVDSLTGIRVTTRPRCYMRVEYELCKKPRKEGPTQNYAPGVKIKIPWVTRKHNPNLFHPTRSFLLATNNASSLYPRCPPQ
jgi:hypothetical protein